MKDVYARLEEDFGLQSGDLLREDDPDLTCGRRFAVLGGSDEEDGFGEPAAPEVVREFSGDVEAAGDGDDFGARNFEPLGERLGGRAPKGLSPQLHVEATDSRSPGLNYEHGERLAPYHIRFSSAGAPLWKVVPCTWNVRRPGYSIP